MATTTIRIKRKNLRLIEKTSILNEMFGIDKERMSKFTEEDRLEDRD